MLQPENIKSVQSIAGSMQHPFYLKKLEKIFDVGKAMSKGKIYISVREISSWQTPEMKFSRRITIWVKCRNSSNFAHCKHIGLLSWKDLHEDF